MSDLRVLYVKVIDVNEEGEEQSGPLYAYLVCDNYGAAFGASYNTIEEVVQEVNRENVVKFLNRKHPEFYKRALENDGQFVFQSEVIPFSKRAVALARKDWEDDR